MKLIFLLFFAMVWTVSYAQEKLSIGEKHEFVSEILQEERELNIHLPLGFSKDSAYPVMYVLDGSAHQDFLHIVGLVQFFQLQFQMPEFIVVGISNVDRKRDFTFPTQDEELQAEFPTTGHSEKFIAFLEKELQPYINTRFQTKNTKYLIGQSLGGLLATQIVLQHPDLFTHYFIVSPSLWWDNESLLVDAAEILQTNLTKPTYVSLSVGKKEHPVLRKDAKAFYKEMKKVKKANLKYNYRVLPKEDHATVLHLALYFSFELLVDNWELIQP